LNQQRSLAHQWKRIRYTGNSKKTQKISDLRNFVERQSHSVLDLRVVKGSHRIFVKNGVREMLNFQNVKGKAKPYQVRQFIRIIEKYKLVEE